MYFAVLFFRVTVIALFSFTLLRQDAGDEDDADEDEVRYVALECFSGRRSRFLLSNCGSCNPAVQFSANVSREQRPNPTLSCGSSLPSSTPHTVESYN